MPSRSCPDRPVRAAVPAPAMTPPRRTLDVSSLSAPSGAAYASKGAPARVQPAAHDGWPPAGRSAAWIPCGPQAVPKESRETEELITFAQADAAGHAASRVITGAAPVEG